jgi:catalase
MKKWSVVSIIGAIIIFVLLGSFILDESYDATIPMGEVIGKDEDKMMADAIASSLAMINNTRNGIISDTDKGETGTGPLVVYGRDVHVKSHGCVMADFKVHDLESKYRWGVFREPKTYKAWIRFSNGQFIFQPDEARDMRGMAVKVMEVKGKKLLAAESDATTQDFVMMARDTYFIRKLGDYVEFTKYLARDGMPQGILNYGLNGPSWNPLSWRFRELKLIAGNLKKAPDSILNMRFFSASAYKLGPDHNIKFSAKPVSCEKDSNGIRSWATPRSDYNFLRKRMIEQLDKAPACFDFMVQLQVPGKNMPVEDATIVWKEKDSPFVPVARITIPKQSFDSDAQNKFCENLSYNPWHALPDHRPIGVFNRVRKALYEEVARYRWAENQQLYDHESRAPTLQRGQPPEPSNWCIDFSTDRDCGPN